MDYVSGVMSGLVQGRCVLGLSIDWVCMRAQSNHTDIGQSYYDMFSKNFTSRTGPFSQSRHLRSRHDCFNPTQRAFK